MRQVDREIGGDTARPRGHDRDAGRQVDRFEDAVGDEDDRRRAALPQPQQVVVERQPRDLVERGERLVEQQEIGVGDERARDRDAHPHPARELARIGALEPGEPDGAQFGRGALALGRTDPAGEAKRQQHVAQHRAPRHQRRVLKDKADPPARRPAAIAAGRGQGQMPHSLARRDQPGDDAQQRALAAARGAEQAEELAAADSEIDRRRAL